MTEQQRVRPLVEGAFLALITAMMGALGIYFLPVKFLVDYIWGIPIIIIIKRYNLRMGLLTLVTTFLITWMFTEPVTTVLLVVELAPLALAYGILFKREFSPGTVFFAGSVVSILSTLLTVLGFIYIAGIDVIPSSEAIRQQARQSVDIYVKAGLIDASDSKQLIETTSKLMVALIPSALAIASVIRAFFTYLITVKVLRKLNYRVEALPPFRDWSLPWYSIWLIISGLGLTIAGDYFKISILSVIGKNMVFMFIPLFFTIGLAVAVNFIRSWKIPAWAKLFMGIIAFVNFSGSVVLFTFLGLFDPVVSFRKWRVPKD